MAAGRDEILDAALQLSESDRLMIVARLLDTLPDDPVGLSINDPDLIAELERRADDMGPTIEAADLWKSS